MRCDVMCMVHDTWYMRILGNGIRDLRSSTRLFDLCQGPRARGNKKSIFGWGLGVGVMFSLFDM
jgi:hypothetical protein